MSVRVMTRVWALDVPHHEQAVLLALADHADDKGGNVYPSMGYIAWKLGYSDRQVRRIVSGLRARGVLLVTRGARAANPTHYRLNLADLPDKAPFREDAHDEMSASQEADASVPDILSSPPHEASGGMTQLCPPTHDTSDRRDDISSKRDDIAVSARDDIAVSAEPSLNRQREPSSEPSLEPSRVRAREALSGTKTESFPPNGGTSPCGGCGDPIPLAPGWRPFCAACSAKRARAGPSPPSADEPATSDRQVPAGGKAPRESPP